jgi:phosphotransferase system HPr (HPr) family protein
MHAEAERLERTVTVGNEFGLHARVATSIAKVLQTYSCKVTVVKDDMEVDARSVLELLLLAATPGTELVVRAQGPDSAKAVQEISRLVQHE